MTVLPGNILEDIYGDRGYSTECAINMDELDFLRKAIFEQWISRLEELYPEHADRFCEYGIEQYHLVSHLVSHEALWTKEHRVLPRDTVLAMRDFEFVRRLDRALGGRCRLCNTVFFSGVVPDHPQAYWRLVRPNSTTDVGAIHTDRWFNDLLSNGRALLYDEKTETTVKLWLAIYSEPGLNGLFVVPGSHRRDWRVRYVPSADGNSRPCLDEPLDGYDKVLIPTVPGQGIVFSENLLHGGAINMGSQCRISIELTFILERSDQTR